jgi:hypothetical protein
MSNSTVANLSTPTVSVAKRPPKVEKAEREKPPRPMLSVKEKEPFTPVPRSHIESLFAEAAKTMKQPSSTAVLGIADSVKSHVRTVSA